MRYALNLGEDNRVLSATYEDYAGEDAVIVENLPEGDVTDYRLSEGEYIYDPVSAEAEPEPGQPLEERVSELEEALAMILEGTTE